MLSKFLPSNFKEWLEFFSAISSFGLIALPMIARRLGKARRDRLAMHKDNIKRFDAIQTIVRDMDITLKIQNGRIKRLEARVDTMEQHIWDGVSERRKTPRHPTDPDN